MGLLFRCCNGMEGGVVSFVVGVGVGELFGSLIGPGKGLGGAAKIFALAV